MDQRFKNWKKPCFNLGGYAYKENKDHHSNDWYGWRCQYPEGLSLGECVDIGCFTYMMARYGIRIGDNTQIGFHCSIYSEDTERGIQGEVIIGRDCLIGSYTLILPGSKIPLGSKIPAFSIIDNKNGETIFCNIFNNKEKKNLWLI